MIRLTKKIVGGRCGLTLIEMLLAMGVFFMLFYLASVAYVQIQQSRLLSEHVLQTVSIVRESYHQAVSGEAVGDQALKFGVRFSQAGYQQFATLTDYDGREPDFDFNSQLPASLEFTNFDLPDSCLQANDCLIFSAGTGTPSASGRITLSDPGAGAEKTIRINQWGGVNF